MNMNQKETLELVVGDDVVIGTVSMVKHVYPKRIVFRVFVDDQVIKEVAFRNDNGQVGDKMKEVTFSYVEEATIEETKIIKK